MDVKPDGYSDLTVYPLDGVWDISDEAKKQFSGTINKDDFVCQLIIRQPGFVSRDFYCEILGVVKTKKPNPLLDQVGFESIAEGQFIQMLHVGRF